MGKQREPDPNEIDLKDFFAKMEEEGSPVGAEERAAPGGTTPPDGTKVTAVVDPATRVRDAVRVFLDRKVDITFRLDGGEVKTNTLKQRTFVDNVVMAHLPVEVLRTMPKVVTMYGGVENVQALPGMDKVRAKLDAIPHEVKEVRGVKVNINASPLARIQNALMKIDAVLKKERDATPNDTAAILTDIATQMGALAGVMAQVLEQDTTLSDPERRSITTVMSQINTFVPQYNRNMIALRSTIGAGGASPARATGGSSTTHPPLREDGAKG